MTSFHTGSDITISPVELLILCMYVVNKSLSMSPQIEHDVKYLMVTTGKKKKKNNLRHSYQDFGFAMCLKYHCSVFVFLLRN